MDMHTVRHFAKLLNGDKIRKIKFNEIGVEIEVEKFTDAGSIRDVAFSMLIDGDKDGIGRRMRATLLFSGEFLRSHRIFSSKSIDERGFPDAGFSGKDGSF